MLLAGGILLSASGVLGADIPELDSIFAAIGTQAIDPAQMQDFDAAVASGSESGEEKVYTPQLVGLFVNGREQSALQVWFDGEHYLLPLKTMLTVTSVSLDVDRTDTTTGQVFFATPGGNVILGASDFVQAAGQVLVRQSALTAKLHMDFRFDQSRYGIFLDLPWDEPGARQAGATASAGETVPDFMPPAASIRNLRSDLSYTAAADADSLTGDFFAAGNLASGTWRFRVRQDESGAGYPLEYFWTGHYRNGQVLLGNSDFSLHPLLPTVEQTGAQLLFSTAPVPHASQRTATGLASTRGIANGIRRIEGRGVPGSVAELRIDGSVVARARVRLDGSYDFPQVELPTRGYSEVLVDILDRGSGTLLERQDFSRRSGIELLGDRQHSLFATLGSAGNPLAAGRQSRDAVAAAQWRYGITENLTIELGRQRAGSLGGAQAAVSAALARNWFASVGVASSPGRRATELDLEGGNDRWTLDLRLRQSVQQGVGGDSDSMEQRHWTRIMSYRYQLTDGLTLGLVGRDVNNGFDNRSFVLPTASWSNRRNFSISTYPTLNGSWRVDSRLSPTRKDIVRYAFENDRHLFDYRRRTGGGREYYANVSVDDTFGNRYEAGVVHNAENRLAGRIQLGLVSNRGGLGYSLDWESKLLPGFDSRLRLVAGGTGVGLYADGDQDADGLFLQWNMTLDFAVAQQRIVPADSGWGRFDSGALTGEVLLDGRRVTRADAIERIELIIDGDSRTAQVQGGRYYIDGLAPGLHKVSVDSRHLPIQLMPGANQDYWIRLEAAAATEMPVHLEARFAIAGRVRDANGDNVTGQGLLIINAAGQEVGEAYTDRFGLYRTGALPPGSYVVVADQDGQRLSSIDVEVIDSFLFEQDLVVP